jgi:prepilin-type N-terminal cleavage/methylation domain-containing protein
MKMKSGFTLVELSIVLVIVGLIIGGVLVGRDLIQSATLRSVISQKEKIQSAIGTFRGKYDCLPGDCTNATASGFTSGWGGLPYDGNGDGIIDDPGGNLTLGLSPAPQNEKVMFWRSLNQAVLISSYQWPSNTQPYGYGFPSTIRTCSWYVGYSAHAVAWPYPAGENPLGNVLALVGPNTVMGYLNSGSALFSECLTPNEAKQLDTKIDDGMPYTGIAQAGAGGNFIDTYAIVGGVWASPNLCTASLILSAPYASPATDNLFRCNLLFKLGF